MSQLHTVRSGLALSDGTSEAVFGLECQHQEHHLGVESTDTYCAVQVKVDVITCGVDFVGLFVVLEDRVAIDDDEPEDTSLVLEPEIDWLSIMVVVVQSSWFTQFGLGK